MLSPDSRVFCNNILDRIGAQALALACRKQYLAVEFRWLF
jgi:hypothetical protein